MTGRSEGRILPIELLGNQRRRHVVKCLSGRDAGMALADLANDVAALEGNVGRHEVPPETVERTYLSLYHCHVPKLADGGLVEHCRERNVVTLPGETRQVEKVRRIAEQ